MKWFCNHRYKEAQRDFVYMKEYITGLYSTEQNMVPVTLITEKCELCNKYKQKTVRYHIKA